MSASDDGSKTSASVKKGLKVENTTDIEDVKNAKRLLKARKGRDYIGSESLTSKGWNSVEHQNRV
ncbi:hypothetical protein CVT25_000233 [Psilocybe cyanescens]|uniref:Uncharacterized protein n=1 Tax=Psilocybe cyanescens TaxID=93625 RepID=A0A409XRV0_PSICY|nr:hypothetical protein CVT25_000233 [Psilocybe cyanescens]